MPISGGDPADLIRSYLSQITNVPASALPVPQGMGDLRERMLDPFSRMKAAPMDPAYVGRSVPGIVPDDSGGGQGRSPPPPLQMHGVEMPQLRMQSPEEEMFKFKDTVSEKDKGKDKESEALRIARAAIEKLKAQVTPTPAPPQPGTPGATPKPAMTPTQGPDTGAENPNADPVRRQAFLAMAVPYALQISKETGIDPRLVLAQAAHESAWGTAAPGYNYFGVKAGANEPGQTLDTKEMVDGKLVPTKARFRTYENPAESFKHYGEVMRKNHAGVLAAKTLPEQLIALGKSGYATDTGYLPKLVKLIESLPPDVQAQLTATTQPDQRARGGHIKDLLALSRNYQ